MARYLIHKKEPIYWGIVRLTVGIWLLYLSCLYLSGSGDLRLKIAMDLDMPIYLMFGAIHAYIMHQFNRIIYDENRDIGPMTETTYIVADLFVYAAFYNIVLLPLCGLGIIEWGLLAYMLFSTLVIAQDRKVIYRFFNPLAFLILGLCLFLLKVAITTLFPQNLYREMISGNDTMRFLLFAMAAMALAYYVKSLFDLRKDHAIQVSTQGRGEKLVVFLGRQATKLGKLVLTGPFLIIALGVIFSLAVIGGAFGFFFLGKLEQDFWNAFGPRLEKLLTTDRQNIILSKSLMIFQTSACLLYLVYFFYNNNLLQKHVENRHKMIKSAIADYYPGDYASLALNDLDRKDGVLVTAAWRDFHRAVEDDFQKSDFHNQGHLNEDAFKNFWELHIKGR
jgi:hypothetical protein